MKTHAFALTLAMGAALAAGAQAQQAASPPAPAQDGIKVVSGFNALQASRVTDGNSRLRLYTGAEADAGPLKLTYAGVTEGDPHRFLYGEHKAALGYGALPVQLVGVERFGHTVDGSPQIPKEHAYGVRADLAHVLGADYGSLDLVRHYGEHGHGAPTEAVLFAGRGLKGGPLAGSTLEAYASVRARGLAHGELELRFPDQAFHGLLLAPFARAESTHGAGYGFVGGVSVSTPKLLPPQ